MIRFTLHTCACALLVACAAAAQDEAAEPFVVKMTGRGATKQEATTSCLKKALTAIVDQAYKPDASEARDRKTRWTRRLLLAHPGYVFPKRHRQLVAQRSADDDAINNEWSITLEVSVTEKRLDDLWNEAQALLGWLGDPSVAVFVADTAEDDDARTIRTDEETSDLGQALKEILEREFFTVKDHRQVEAKRQARLNMAKLREKSLEILQQIKDKDAAKIFVTGTCRTVGPTPHSRNGQRGYDWNSDAKVDIYWTDDSTKIAVCSATDCMGSDVGKRAGAIASLQNAARQIATVLIDRVFEKWSRWAFEGRTVTIKIDNTDQDQEDAITDGLEELAEKGLFEVVDSESENGIMEIKVKTKLKPSKLDRAVRRMELEGFALERGGYRTNTMQLRIKS